MLNFVRSLPLLLLLAAGSSRAAIEMNPVPANPPVQLSTSSTLSLPPTADETFLLPDDEPAPVVARRRSGWDEKNFPRYPALQPAVAFWTRIFGDYSENQSVIHSALEPAKAFTVLDFRGDAVTLTPGAFAKKRTREETQTKQRYEVLLKQVHALRHSPEQMTHAQRRVFDLFSDQADDDRRFIRLAGTLRAQRGLKERTELALETSGKYLPHMESIFSQYALPTQLTRLPLVESSFNVEAYSKVGAAGLWQFIPSSARIYMRLNDIVDDRRDPWTSTDAAARHLRDDYKALGSWPLALTAYNHGRSGIARGLAKTGSSTLPELIERYRHKNFGFASRNFYAEFLAASDVEQRFRAAQGRRKDALSFDTVETRHYVPYETLRRLCGADDTMFRKLNPAYRPEVIEGKLYVPPGHIIRVPAGRAKSFEVSYEKLTSNERFNAQKAYFQLHRVKRGEALSRIAREYGVSTRSILSANGIKRANKLRAGQTLKIPPRIESRPGPISVAIGESKPTQTRAQKLAATEKKSSKGRMRTHRVKSGQTLSSIARRYKVSVSSLQAANNLGDSSDIRIGMRLKVPASSG